MGNRSLAPLAPMGPPLSCSSSPLSVLGLGVIVGSAKERHCPLEIRVSRAIEKGCFSLLNLRV